MPDLKISEMLEMQKNLLAKHPNWRPHCPDTGIRQLLWMVGELGEVIDVIKKKSEEEYMSPGPLREHLLEEFTDVMMYLNDALLCYGITPEEISQAYLKKHEWNMVRDYVRENKELFSSNAK